MFERAVDVLEKSTREYWDLSSIRYGTLQIRMSTEQAIDAVNTLQMHLGPNRRLLNSVRGLSNSIITGRSKRKPSAKLPSNLISL